MTHIFWSFWITIWLETITHFFSYQIYPRNQLFSSVYSHFVNNDFLWISGHVQCYSWSIILSIGLGSLLCRSSRPRTLSLALILGWLNWVCDTSLQDNIYRVSKMLDYRSSRTREACICGNVYWFFQIYWLEFTSDRIKDIFTMETNDCSCNFISHLPLCHFLSLGCDHPGDN